MCIRDSSMGIGMAIVKVGDRAKPLADLFYALNECVLIIIRYVIWGVPIGVCSLIISKLGTSDDFFGKLSQLGMFVLTVVSGLFIHTFIFLPTCYFVLVRKNPYKFIYGLSQALMVALGTSSSAATLPITMKNCQENNGLSAKVVRFTLPLGATINMNGTALYEAMAAIFIAQSLDMELSVGKMMITAFTATLAAVGAAGIPEAGLVTMVMVFTAVGLPLEGIGLLFSIDWFLDRLRTACNVLGDAFGAGIVAHYFPELNEDEPTEPVDCDTSNSEDNTCTDKEVEK
eukprot:TRINITY_DN7223_c0_g1_i1.p1 TRINITY_DN7223_c0_g1~~TRINITY_DN7223_c0_g1_i1.p1  ORF type:complete len:287 (+),score=42.44 TRINITY_DN7223_c0_g1_i1:52-912(+)